MASLIRAANLRGIQELAAQLGHDAEPLLARFHINPDAIDDAGSYLSYPAVARFLERAALEFNCPDFGLRLAQWQGLDMLGAVAVIARNASDVLQAFQGIARYLHVHGPALNLKLTGQNAAGDYCFNFRIEEPGLINLEQSYELSMANGAKILSFLTANAAYPAQVYFMHRRQSAQANYRRVFGCPVHFEQAHYGFDIKAVDVRRPLHAADRQTLHLAEQYLESHQAPDARLSDRVAELIHRLLPTGYCQINTIADQLALHPRTLQRRLKNESLRYEDLVDAIRRKKAQEYLAVTALQLSQIAGLLGYSEQSAFNRACRRWFNCAPNTLRKKLHAVTPI